MRNEAQERVILHLQDAHAMEQTVLGMLESMISTTTDGFILTLLQEHRAETVLHERRIAGRLQQLGSSPSLTKSAVGVMESLLKTAVDMVRSEKACKNLRDGYIAEQAEIAGYELLERYAKRAGDRETLVLVGEIKADEEKMAKKLSELWDRVVELDLHAAGVGERV